MTTVLLGGSSPQIARVATGAMVVDEVVDVEFEYTTGPAANDPQTGSATRSTCSSTGPTRSPSPSAPWSGQHDSVHQHRRPAVHRQLRPRRQRQDTQCHQPVHAAGQLPILSFPSSIVVGIYQLPAGCALPPAAWHHPGGRVDPRGRRAGDGSRPDRPVTPR